MTDEDPFTSFRVAFEKQRNEIQHLYNRMSELEKVNSEVLSYVRQKGTLPELHCSCKSIGVTGAGSHGSETDLRQSSLCSFSPEPFAVNPYTVDDHMEGGEVTENSQALSAPLLSNLIAKHTVELNEVLETLGLESSQRTQLLKQIQSNMSSILFSQIKREPVAKVNGELTVSSSQQNPDFKASQSLRSSLQSTGSNPLRETFASEDQADQLSSASNDDQQVTSSFTDVHQKRRQELQRINQKMYSSATVVGSPQAVAVPNYSIALNRQPDTCWSSPFVRTQSVRMDSSLGKRALCQAESDHASTHLFAGLSREIPRRQPNSVTSQLDTYLEALCKKSQQKSQLRSPNSVVEKPCPCGNRNTCPLTLIKQRRFANDPRVQRGFIRIAALFRGRLVRRLLTTNKVYDLIRTVKDTAKLALSIHIERQESNKQPLCNPDTPDADPSDALSSQELILESRLLNQLRGSLSQLHEIFFVWPISARIELLHITRSAPPRKKNPTVAHRLHDESTRSSGPASENSRSSWTHSTIPEYRHHSEGNVVQPVQRDGDWTAKPSQRTVAKTGSSGCYSLSKRIDSARQTRPPTQANGKKRISPFPVSGLEALAYDTAETVLPSENPYQKNPIDRNPDEDKRLNKLPRNLTHHNDPSPPESAAFTPVKLYTPPPPAVLEYSIGHIPRSKMVHRVQPVLQPQAGHVSCFNLHQMSDKLRNEKMKQYQLEPNSTVAHMRESRSQQRPTHLQRREALVYRRPGSAVPMTESDMLRMRRQIVRVRPFCPLYRPCCQRDALRYRSLSSIDLNCPVCHHTRRKQLFQSTPTLAEGVNSATEVAPVPYWKEVLKQWRNQTSETRSDPYFQQMHNACIAAGDRDPCP
ncbi:unnamed protein product [Calicophoron daubneyi]|uniref:Uncharacterized protein n=1 Tax=Calicophoron daubneyi TaxID=300641 RepID=A0AAV2TD73_CALDB